MLNDLFAVMAPTLVGTLIGWIWAKKSIPFPAEFVSKIVMYIGTPCLFISVMSQVHVSADEVSKMAGAFALGLCLMALISVAIIRLMGLEMRAYLPPLIFPNNGNMGLPICLFAIGQEGLALALAPLWSWCWRNLRSGYLLWRRMMAVCGAAARILFCTPLLYPWLSACCY